MFNTQETTEIRSFIHRAYASSPELVSKWHVTAGAGLAKCVDRTVSDLTKCDSLKFYVVTENEKFVGYFGVEFEGTYMPTIFISPEYRSRKDEFWKELELKTERSFHAGIYSKNIPCKKFYSKIGKLVGEVSTPDGPGIVYEFKKVEVV